MLGLECVSPILFLATSSSKVTVWPIIDLQPEVGTGLGFYMLYSGGWKVSNCDKSDCGSHDLKYSNTDTVTVEFEPVTRKLLFTIEGKSLVRKKEMATTIDSSTIAQARFCVALYNATSVAAIKH